MNINNYVPPASTANTPNNFIKRIAKGNSVTGVSIALGANRVTREDLLVPVNNVKDAFTYRKWLIKLVFAQNTFVVSIKGTEAATAEEAARMAAQRATLSHLEAASPLGNLMGFEAVEDTTENRKKLRVDGGETYVEYIPRRAA